MPQSKYTSVHRTSRLGRSRDLAKSAQQVRTLSEWSAR